MRFTDPPDQDRGLCLWFTGRPCAGKSTIAQHLAHTLEARGKTVSVLDGDVVRPILCPDLGYTREDRLASLSRLAFVASELLRHGATVLVVTVAPFEEHRRWIRSQFRPSSFAQVYVRASASTCEHRDVKSMYRAARAGVLGNFTGIQSPFEEPSSAEIVCETERASVEECSEQVLQWMEDRMWRRSRLMSA